MDHVPFANIQSLIKNMRKWCVCVCHCPISTTVCVEKETCTYDVCAYNILLYTINKLVCEETKIDILY